MGNSLGSQWISFLEKENTYNLKDRINLKVDDGLSTNRCFITSLGEKWTCDPFDRLIVSHAKLKACPLVSKDLMIRKNYAKTIW